MDLEDNLQVHADEFIPHYFNNIKVESPCCVMLTVGLMLYLILNFLSFWARTQQNVIKFTDTKFH